MDGILAKFALVGDGLCVCWWLMGWGVGGGSEGLSLVIVDT